MKKLSQKQIKMIPKLYHKISSPLPQDKSKDKREGKQKLCNCHNMQMSLNLNANHARSQIILEEKKIIAHKIAKSAEAIITV